MEGKYVASEKNFKEAIEQLDKKKKQEDEFQKKVKSTTAELEAMEGKYAASEKNLKEAIEQLDKKKKQEDELQKKVKSITVELEAMERKYVVSEKNLKEAKEQLDKGKEQEDELQKKVKAITVELEAMERKYVASEGNLEEAIEQLNKHKVEGPVEIKKRIAEKAEVWERRKQELLTKIDNLSIELKQTRKEFEAFKLRYFDSRRELFAANKKLREIEEKSFSSILLLYYQRLRSVKELQPIFASLSVSYKQCTAWIFDVSTQLRTALLELLDGPMVFVKGLLVSGVSFAEKNIDFTALVMILNKYAGLERLNYWLKALSHAVYSYCVLEHGGNKSSWIYSGSHYIYEHSESVSVWVEVVTFLKVLQFLISTTLFVLSTRKKKKTGKKGAKH